MSIRARALTPVELKSEIVRNPLVVSPDTRVRDAIAQMSSARSRSVCAEESLYNTPRTEDSQLDDLHLEARSSCVLVVEDGQLVGILTERDVVRLSAQQQPLDSLVMRQVMVHPVVTLRVSAFTDLFFAVNQLDRHHIHHLPILDDRDRLVGLVTRKSLRPTSRLIDLLRWRQVAEVMTREVICAAPDCSMLAIAQRMADHRVSTIVIVQPCGSSTDPLHIPVGILTERDLVQFQALGLSLESCTAEAVMSKPIFAVKPEESLWTVQQIMGRRSIRRLAVTGEQGELLGIVTQTSLLQAFNPLALLYKQAEVLEAQVVRLETEKVALLENRTVELERQVEARTVALQNKAEREKLFVEIATQIRSSLSLQTILDTTVTQVRQVLGCDRVNIWRFESDWQTVAVAESTDSPLSLVGERIDDTCFKQDQTEIYRQGRIRVISDLHTIAMSDCHRKLLNRLQTRAKILVPLMCGDRLWGLLNATESQHARDWQPEEVELLQALSVQLAIALQQATTHQQLQEELNKRRQAEIQLRESEQRYATLVTAAPVGIFRTDAVGNCTYVNDRWCQIAGLTPEAAMEKGWRQGLHPDDRNAIAAEWDRSAQENRPFRLEYRFQRSDGAVTWVYGQSVAERDVNGQAIGYVGTITDISDRKQAEIALQNLIEGTAATTGQDFFPALVTHIAEALNISCAAVSELIDDELNLLALWANGALQLSFSYDPAHTPCERVLQDGQFYCETSVQQMFPQDLYLVETEAESYLGIALRDTNGTPIGSLCIINKQPIQDLQQAENLLRVFAARAAAELERQRASTLLEQLNQKLEAKIAERTQELWQVNNLQRAILDGADYSIISTDPTGIIQTFNAAAERMLGYSAAEIVGKLTPQVIHDRQEVLQRAASLSVELGQDITPGFEVFVAKARQGIVSEEEWTYIRKDGDRFPVLLSISALKDANQQIMGFLGIAKDITERKRAEAELQKVSERLSLSLKSGEIGCWEWDIVANTLLWDERMHELYGVSKLAIARTDGEPRSDIAYESWANGLHPDDRIPTETLLQQAVLGQAEYDTEFRVIHPDGSIRFIKAFGMVVRDARGTPQSMIGVNFDISDRKRAEIARKQVELERQQLIQELFSFKLALDYSAIVAITDAQGVITYVNDRFCTISGYTRDELIGQTHQLVNSGYHPPSFFQDLWYTISNAQIWRGEICNRAKNGSLYWVASTIVPFLNEQGQPFQYLAIRFDITDRKFAEARLEQENTFRQQIVENMAEGLCVCYEIEEFPFVRFTVWNQQMQAITGYTLEHINRLGWYQSFYPDPKMQATAIARIGRMRQGKNLIAEEWEIQCQDGLKRTVAISTSVLSSNDGLTYILALIQDITDRKQTEQENRLLKERLQFLLASSPAMIYSCKPDGDYGATFMSENIQTILGYKPEEFVAESSFWASHIHPDDAPKVFAELPALFESGIHNREYRFLHRDGRYIWLRDEMRLVRNDRGKPIEIIGYFADISDRKSAEAKVNQQLATIEAAIDGIAILQGDTYLYLNQAHLELFGYERPEELVGKSWTLLYSQEELERFDREIFPVLGRDRAWQGEAIATRKDGSTFAEGLSLTLTDEGLLICVCRDISDRKQIEAELAESEAKFRRLVEGANDLIWSSDKNGILTYLSPQFKTLFGWDEREWIGKPFIELVHPDDRPLLITDHRENIQVGKKSSNSEFRHRHRDGSYLWVRTSATPVKNAEGALISIQGILSDISDLKQAEIALHASEIRFRRMFESSVVGIVFADFQGRIVDANDRFLQMVGYTREELNAGAIHWDEMTPPEYIPGDIAAMGHLMQGGFINPWEKEYYRKDGSRVPILIGAALLPNTEGQTVCVLVDISDRKQAEARLRQQADRERLTNAIAQRIRSSLNLQDILNTTVAEVHQVLQSDRVLVYRVLPDGTGKTIAESVSPGLPAIVDRIFSEEIFPRENYDRYVQGRIFALSDRETESFLPCLADFLKEMQVRAKLVVPIIQNKTLWGLLIAHQCTQPRQWQSWEIELLRQLSGQLAIAIQQSELYAQLQQNHHQLTHANAELIRATRLKDEFLANMSHELRTPLNAILGMTEGLQEKVFGEINNEQLKALQTIDRSGSHLLELINDILDIAKIESGQLELDCTPTAVAPLCQFSLAFIKQLALKKRIQLEINLPHNLPDLFVDERRIRQVLINLLNNAVKFTPEGGRITLEVSRLQLAANPDPADSPPQKYLRIAVIDTGIGIAPENINKLFHPFIQIDSALNRQYQGTGLGLAMVKRIVELHDGQVGLTSEVGVGSCFTIDLPCSTAAFSATAPETQPEPSIEPSPSEQKASPLILLAEDNEANISTISSYLRAKGYRLLLAKNGREAIARAQSENPDLILMDIQMPEMDGLEAMKQIRRDPNLVNVPIVALTSLAMTDDRDRCLAAGANDYFSKPVKLKQLASAIQFLLTPK